MTDSDMNKAPALGQGGSTSMGAGGASGGDAAGPVVIITDDAGASDRAALLMQTGDFGTDLAGLSELNLGEETFSRQEATVSLGAATFSLAGQEALSEEEKASGQPGAGFTHKVDMSHGGGSDLGVLYFNATDGTWKFIGVDDFLADLNEGETSEMHFAVTVTKEVTVTRGPGESEPLEISLPDGRKVTVTREAGELGTSSVQLAVETFTIRFVGVGPELQNITAPADIADTEALLADEAYQSDESLRTRSGQFMADGPSEDVRFSVDGAERLMADGLTGGVILSARDGATSRLIRVGVREGTITREDGTTEITFAGVDALIRATGSADAQVGAGLVVVRDADDDGTWAAEFVADANVAALMGDYYILAEVTEREDGSRKIIEYQPPLSLIEGRYTHKADHGDGTLYFNETSGEWAFVAKAESIDSLSAGERAVIHFEVTAHKDGEDSAPEMLAITLTGADEPVAPTPAPAVPSETAFIEADAKASLVVHGVRFTVNEAGADGNNIWFDIRTAKGASAIRLRKVAGGNGVEKQDRYEITLDTRGGLISQDDLIRLWNSDTERVGRISAEKVETLGDAAPHSIAGTSARQFSGGGNDKSVTFTIIPTGTFTPDDLHANGILHITDAEGVRSVTHTAARYGTFTFDEMTGAWFYTLDPRDADTLNLPNAPVQETITFTVTDIGGMRATHDLVIRINDDHATAVSLANAAALVLENTTDMKVADISLTDADGGDPGALQLTGADAGLFEIRDGAEGKELWIRDDADINFEAPTTSLSVRVYLTEDASIGADFTATVNNVSNEFTSPKTVVIDENTSFTTDDVVYQSVVAADDGTTPTGQYNLESSSGLFSINATTGAVSFKQARTLDFEEQSSYTFTVRFGTIEQDVTLLVTDLDEDVTFTSDATANTLADDASVYTTLIVYTASAEGGAIGSTITYSLKTGGDSDLFRIDNEGNVFFRDTTTTDFDTKSAYSFTVIANDGEGRTAELEVTIPVQDGDSLAMGITLSNMVTELGAEARLSESVRVADVTITDPDGGSFGTLELVGDDAAKFQLTFIPSGRGLTLRIGTELTAGDVLDVRVQLAENPNVGADFSLAINVAPTLSTITATLADTAAEDTFTTPLAGDFSDNASDADGDALTYRVVHAAASSTLATALTDDEKQAGMAGEGFTHKVAGTYGVLYYNQGSGAWNFIVKAEAVSVINALDAGDMGEDRFDVTANDGALDSHPRPLIITLNGANDAPVLTAMAETVADTPANDTFDDLTGTFGAIDADGDTVTYSVTRASADTAETGFTHSVSGTYGTLFYNENSGAWKYDVTADAAVNALAAGASGMATFTITATDDDTTPLTSAPQTLTITFTGSNEAPTATPPNVLVVNEGERVAITLAHLGFADRDGGTLQSITITGLPGKGNLYDNKRASFSDAITTSPVTITRTAIENGDLVFAPANNLRDNVDRTLTFTASDGTNDSATATLTIRILADDDYAAVALTNTTASINENTAIATARKVADITLNDPDGGTKVGTPELVAGTHTALFELRGDNTNGWELWLKANANGFDRETTPTLSVRVQLAEDRTIGAEYTLTVSNVDELVVFTSPATAPAIDEGVEVAANAAVYTAQASDPEGAAITYRIKAGGDAALFNIDPTTGAVTFKAATTPDFASKPFYGFTVLASDGTSVAVEQAVTLPVTRDNPTVFEETGGISRTIYGIEFTLNDPDDARDGITLELVAIGTFSHTVSTLDERYIFDLQGNEVVTNTVIKEGKSVTITELVPVTITQSEMVELWNEDADRKAKITATIVEAMAAIETGALAEQYGDGTSKAISVLDKSVKLANAGDISDARNDLLASGRLAISDADGVQSIATSTPQYGTFTFDKTTGVWEYTLDPARLGATTLPAKETITFTVIDSLNREDTYNLVIAINSSTSATSITLQNIATSSVDEGMANPDGIKVGDIVITDMSGLPTATLQLMGKDADRFEIRDKAGGGKELWIRAGLVFDHEVRETLQVRIQLAEDNDVGLDHTLTVNDLNEAPRLATITNTDGATELTVADTAAHESGDAFTDADPSGTFTATDVDDGDVVTYRVAGGVPNTGIAGFTHSVSGTYGALFYNSGSGAWRFVINGAKVNALPAGPVKTDTFMVTAMDDNTPTPAVSAPRTLTITFTGANDAPILGAIAIPAVVADTSANPEAPDAFADLTGTFTATDADATDADDSLTFSVAGAADAAALMAAEMASGEMGEGFTHKVTSSDYGVLYYHDGSPAATGRGAWKFVVDAEAVNELAGGARERSIFAVTATDDEGAASAPLPLIIRFTGTDDLATRIILNSPVTVVTENTPGLTKRVASIAFIGDPDGGNPGTLELVGAATVTEKFEIVGRELRIKAGAELNHEATPQITLRIQLAENNAVYAEYTLTVEDADDIPTATPQDVTLAQPGDSHTFRVADFGFMDEDVGSTFVSVRIASLPLSGEGMLTLAGIPVERGKVIPFADIDAGNLVYTAAHTAPAQASFFYTVSDGTNSSRSTSMAIMVTGGNMPPQANFDTDIFFTSGEALVLTRLELEAIDRDTPDTDLIYRLTAITGGTLERAREDSPGTWDEIVNNETFTQDEINRGVIRLNATGDGSFTVTVADGSNPPIQPETITFRARIVKKPTGVEVGGADLDLTIGTEQEAAIPRFITSGLGNTAIKPGTGDDDVDPGLGDDDVDLGAGGKDTVLYRFATDDDGNPTTAWGGGDDITGFTPGEDRLRFDEIGGDGAGAFLDGLDTGFVVTLDFTYTGGDSGDRTDLDDYNVRGIEFHFSQALVLPGGVLGGSILSITFNTPIAWADSGTPGDNDYAPGFKTTWLTDEAFANEEAFDTEALLFNNNAAGKAALVRILGLYDADVADPRSVAVGNDDDNIIDLANISEDYSEWVVFGGGGDDTITLKEGRGSGEEEIVYRLAVDDADGSITPADGSDMISGFTLGQDKLTFVDTAGAGAGTPADIDALLGGLTEATFAVNADGDYTGMSLTLGRDSDGNDAILEITFAEVLLARELASRLGGDTTAAEFFGGTAPSPSSTATVATTEQEHIADLFGVEVDITPGVPTDIDGDGRLNVADTLPPELL